MAPYRPKKRSYSSLIKGKKRPSVSKKQKPNEIASFSISDDSLSGFKRLASHENDCVVNGLEMIGVLTAENAAIVRCIIEPSGGGIYDKSVEMIFTLFYPDYTWTYSHYRVFENFTSKIIADLPAGHITFCIIKYKNEGRHTFLIGKTNNGKFIYIDGQIGSPYYCFLENPTCLSYLQNGIQWGFLKAKKGKNRSRSS
jgi:hypothetical protein